MAFSLSRLERMYLANETTYGVIPALAGSNACRHARLVMNNDVAVIQRIDKTGSRSQTPGTAGRKFANWSCTLGMAGSGTAGTPPKSDPFLRAVFGKAPTGSVYTFDDAIPSISIWSFRQPAGLSQRVCHGAVATRGIFRLGEDAASMDFSGTGQWVLQSDQFAVAGVDATQKGGLVSFPVEPTPVATDAGLTIGFTGSVTADGNVMANIRTAQVEINTLNEVVRDTFGSFYPDDVQGGERTVNLTFSVYDKNDTGTERLREVANSKTPVDITLVVGLVAGNIWTFALKNVQLAAENLNEPNLRYASDYSGSRAYSTTLTALDEMSLTLT
jgi:hypothetical protein